ncbi:MAG: RNA 3'-terminal phosphate cyclase [Thermoplasmata archaeon]|nr:MAG: RNA 3'-terminal phosphate cyclase [Thermoplasmata archaeon]
MIIIDGSVGEGGGQILRTSIALSALTQKPIRINNIRSNRPKPGLAAQHLTSIKAVSMLCRGKTRGLDLGSTELDFTPGDLSGGTYELDIGTAGSITLVLQACLPVALRSPNPTTLSLKGGTDVKYSPPIDYFKYVLKPILEKMGAGIELKLIKRGYYPKGGGEVKIDIIPPDSGWKDLFLAEPEKFEKVHGIVHYANLPNHISRRIKSSAISEFKNQFDNKKLELEIEQVSHSLSPGVGITLWSKSPNTVIGSSALGERGIPAEKLAINALKDLLTEIQVKATVDKYAADQLLIYLAVCNRGCILARAPLSTHAQTNIEVIETFFGKIFQLKEQEKVIEIKRFENPEK